MCTANSFLQNSLPNLYSVTGQERTVKYPNSNDTCSDSSTFGKKKKIYYALLKRRETE